MTSLEEAKKISSAGTSTIDAGTTLSERETLIEFAIQKPSNPLSVQSMSETRETPAERQVRTPQPNLQLKLLFQLYL